MDVFDASGFPPRWACGIAWQEQPAWGWITIVSDVLIWGAYLAIPIVLLYFIRHRRDIPFPRVFWLFGAFIFACGTVHLIEAIIFWVPLYRLSAVVKLATALVSWATVVAIIPIIPRALTLRSPAQLESEVAARTLALQQATERQRQDSHERERISVSLQDSEARLRLALGAGRMGIWDWDLVTNMVHFDDTEIALTGVETVQNMAHIDEFYARVHPDDRAGVSSALQRAFDGLDDYSHEFRMVRPNGEIRWLSGRGSVLRNEAGQSIRMVGVNFDVSDRKRVDEDLRLLTRAIESATNGILITDARRDDHPIIYTNPAFAELTGYSFDEALNRNCRFLQGPETAAGAVAQLHAAVEQKHDCEVTILNYRKNGTPFWNDLHISPVEDEHGQVTHFVGIQNDVTTRARQEQELRHAQQQAEIGSRAKSEFLANMSHEIRTPLTAILGCADTLFSQLDEEESLELIQMIRSQGRLLLGILNDVLDLSKIEAGRLEIHHEPCSAVSIVNDVRSLMEPLAQERGLILNAGFASDMPVSINTDGLRIRQILLNLVSNAIKFTDTGTVSIEGRCEFAGLQAELILEVADTGIGIPPDKLDEIFEAFSQQHQEPSRRVGGTGLGLTICQRLIHMLGGRITVSSELNQGSTFRIALPLGATMQLELRPAAQIEAEQVAPAETSLTVDLSHCRLLVAEDTRGIQFMLRRMLEELVGEVVVVNNGQEAVDELKRAEQAGESYDLVLMDMQMPLLNGFEATQRLRRDGYRQPIIALTAGAMKGDREKCLAVGCDDYLSKPFDWQQLMHVVRKHVRPANNS